MGMTEPRPVGEKGEIRCFCSRAPLLGVFGVNTQGEPFIHIKVWKQKRLYTELVLSGKSAKISMKCRNCYRWYNIFITDSNTAQMVETTPVEVQNADQPLVDVPV